MDLRIVYSNKYRQESTLCSTHTIFLYLYSHAPTYCFSESEIGKIEMMRNLWSAHIFSLENEIYDLIGMLCGTSIVSLQRLLQRVCIQLSDLAAPIAVFVIKAVLDAFKKHFGSESTDVVEKILAFVQALLDQVRYIVHREHSTMTSRAKARGVGGGAIWG